MTRMEPRVLNCIENDLTEVMKTPRTRRLKKSGGENMTPPSDTSPNKSFFKANHLETLQPVKHIINGESIHFSLPDGNAKLSDEIPFVDVSDVASDLFLTTNNLQRLKNVQRLVAEGRIVLPKNLCDVKFTRAYPYVFVGHQEIIMKVKKRVSFSNMDIEINEFSIPKRLKLASPNTRGVLKKPSVFKQYVEPKKKVKPKIGPASKMKVWRSEMKNTGVKLKLTKRKVSIDSPGEEKLRRNSVDGEHLRATRAKTKPVETITISDEETEGSGRRRRTRVNQTSETSTVPAPPPIRTKAALKMMTPSSSESDVIYVSETKKPAQIKGKPRKKRGKKSVNGKKKKWQKNQQIQKNKPAAGQHVHKKGKSMPFKFRLAKNFKYSDFSCDKCNSIFKKNVDLQQHLVKHIKPEKLVINIVRIQKEVIDSKLKKDIEVPLQEFKRLSLNSEEPDEEFVESPQSTSANSLEVEAGSSNKAEESFEVDKEQTEIKDVGVVDADNLETLSDEAVNLGEKTNLEGKDKNLEDVEVNAEKDSTNNVVETRTENDCDEIESNTEKEKSVVDDEDKNYENGVSESEQEPKDTEGEQEELGSNHDNEEVELVTEDEDLSSNDNEVVELISNHDIEEETQEEAINLSKSSENGSGEHEEDVILCEDPKSPEQPEDALEVISKIKTDLEELCFQKTQQDDEDRGKDMLSNEDLINILVDTDGPGKKRKRCKSILLDGRKDSMECDTPKGKRVRFASEKIVMCDDNSISKENMDEDVLREAKVSVDAPSDETLLNDVEKLMQEEEPLEELD